MRFWTWSRDNAVTLEPDKYLFEPKDDITTMEIAELLRCIHGPVAYDFQVKRMPENVARHFARK